jgi:hypothetical protein
MGERLNVPMWPKSVVRRFQQTNKQGDEKEFYPPYNKLLCTQFPPDSDFTVAPVTYPISTRESIDFVIEYVVNIDNYPVFILEIKPEKSLDLLSARSNADIQMRKRLLDLQEKCPIDVLNGISAFGNKVAFYSYNKVTRQVLPKLIPENLDTLVDTAPVSRWYNDILSKDTYIHVTNIFDDIKSKCRDLNF